MNLKLKDCCVVHFSKSKTLTKGKESSSNSHKSFLSTKKRIKSASIHRYPLICIYSNVSQSCLPSQNGGTYRMWIWRLSCDLRNLHTTTIGMVFQIKCHKHWNYGLVDDRIVVHASTNRNFARLDVTVHRLNDPVLYLSRKDKYNLRKCCF